jgi:hypothetical protein
MFVKWWRNTYLIVPIRPTFSPSFSHFCLRRETVPFFEPVFALLFALCKHQTTDKLQKLSGTGCDM